MGKLAGGADVLLNLRDQVGEQVGVLLHSHDVGDEIHRRSSCMLQINLGVTVDQRDTLLEVDRPGTDHVEVQRKFCNQKE